MHLQEILDLELARFGDQPLDIVETGTIRNDSEASRIGDGWSTIYFAERTKRLGGTFVSIDLDIRRAEKMLSERGLLSDRCRLVEGHSVGLLTNAARAKRDVILLDSDNDGHLIFREYMAILAGMRSGGLILVDDVRMPGATGEAAKARKGDVLLSWIQKHGHHMYRLTEREGWNGYRTGVLAIDC